MSWRSLPTRPVVADTGTRRSAGPSNGQHSWDAVEGGSTSAVVSTGTTPDMMGRAPSVKDALKLVSGAPGGNALAKYFRREDQAATVASMVPNAAAADAFVSVFKGVKKDQRVRLLRGLHACLNEGRPLTSSFAQGIVAVDAAKRPHALECIVAMRDGDKGRLLELAESSRDAALARRLVDATADTLQRSQEQAQNWPPGRSAR